MFFAVVVCFDTEFGTSPGLDSNPQSSGFIQFSKGWDYRYTQLFLPVLRILGFEFPWEKKPSLKLKYSLVLLHREPNVLFTSQQRTENLRKCKNQKEADKD